MILAEKIMNLRKKNGWSQEDLAEKLNISRQSVSKWESGTSIPDIDKILSLSALFGVSTDYLLRDELEEEQASAEEDVYEPSEKRSISLEEATEYMKQVAEYAKKFAWTVLAFVSSPIPLILLVGLQEYSGLPISEDAAGGLGTVIVLFIVAVNVAVLISNSMKLEKYKYLSTESLSLQYGVRGIVAKKKEDFAQTWRRCITLGTVLCILGVVPIILAAAFSGGDMLFICCTAVLLGFVAVGAFLFTWSGTIEESYDKLLEEGDYTPEKKKADKKTGFFTGCFWFLAAAIYLGLSFYYNSWKISWVVWPIAALLFVVISSVIREAEKKQ